MTIAQAFKHKNKLVKEIKTIEARIQSNNSYIDGTKVNYDVRTLFTELSDKKADLVTLKTAIIKANVPIYSKIYELAELKSKVSLLKNLNTKEGKEILGYRETKEVEYISVISQLEVDRNILTAETAIEKIQEELDQFNYNTVLK